MTNSTNSATTSKQDSASKQGQPTQRGTTQRLSDAARHPVGLDKLLAAALAAAGLGFGGGTLDAQREPDPTVVEVRDELRGLCEESRQTRASLERLSNAMEARTAQDDRQADRLERALEKIQDRLREPPR